MQEPHGVPEEKCILHFLLLEAGPRLGAGSFLLLLSCACPQQPILGEVKPSINNPQLTN